MAGDLLGIIQEQGFAFVGNILGKAELAGFENEAERLLAGDSGGGVRNVLVRSEPIRDWADGVCQSEMLKRIEPANWQPVRCILFQKSAAENWALRWHQDSALTFREKARVDGFGPWSLKDGVPHAISPQSVLQQVLALRLHLDYACTKNGALEVLPGTHETKLDRNAIVSLGREKTAAVCCMKAGSAMLMRPLIIHRSCRSTSARPRRIIHLELAPGPPPAPLEWAGA